MNVGVLGGTFDPIHLGHLAVAQAAYRRLDLSEVFFVPAGRPWLNKHSPILANEHRVAMVRLAIAPTPYFKLSMVEVERSGRSYTVDTLVELRHQLGEECDLYFILGMDNLMQLPQWYEPFRLIELCQLVAVPRVGYSAEDLMALEVALPGISRRIIWLDMPEIDISSSEVRRRVAHGLPINQQVPEAVDEYIRRHQLYLTQEAIEL